MKKLIYGSLFLAIVGIGIVGCKKEEMVSSNTDDVSSIRADILNIFHSYQKDDINNNIKNFNYENSNNPSDSIGFLHNKVLKFIMSDNETEICNKFQSLNTEFDVNISNDCDLLFNLCEVGMSGTFDIHGNFKIDLLLNLYHENKIEIEEYDIVSTAFLNSNSLGFNDKMDFIKNIEEYIIENSVLNTEQKNRLLRTFSIYRYSSYYWEIENPQPNALGPLSAYADACAEYWATNSPDSPAQDGSDVYAFAGAVSAFVHLITGW